MQLVVGLGNPGEKYTNTRHNVGFHVVATLCSRWGIPSTTAGHGSLVAQGAFQGSPTTLARPQQYMNRSGQPVAALMAEQQLSPKDIVVVHDEMGLPFGDIRCKAGGGHGGHNGLRDIIAHIGSDFLRVRFGIGRPESGGDVTEHVLGVWTQEQANALNEAIDVACDAVEVTLADGIVAAQNRFNVRLSRKSQSLSQSQSRLESEAMEQS